MRAKLSAPTLRRSAGQDRAAASRCLEDGDGLRRFQLVRANRFAEARRSRFWARSFVGNLKIPNSIASMDSRPKKQRGRCRPAAWSLPRPFGVLSPSYWCRGYRPRWNRAGTESADSARSVSMRLQPIFLPNRSEKCKRGPSRAGHRPWRIHYRRAHWAAKIFPISLRRRRQRATARWCRAEAPGGCRAARWNAASPIRV